MVLPPITGFGGLGKTQLVYKLIAQYKDKYDHIVWVNAPTRAGIEASYRQIAEDLGIKLQSDDKEASEKPIEDVLKEVQGRLNNKRVLYVFDNAPNFTTIETLFSKGPCAYYLKEQCNIFLLLP